MVCSFNQSANLCDITTTASRLSRNTTVASSTSNATLTPSITTSLRSNVQSGSSHASSQTVPQHLFEGDESGATREKVIFGVFAVLVMVVCAFVTYILYKRWILRCRNCSGGNSDVETGNAPHGSDDTELRDVNNTGNNGEDIFTCKKSTFSLHTLKKWQSLRSLSPAHTCSIDVVEVVEPCFVVMAYSLKKRKYEVWPSLVGP